MMGGFVHESEADHATDNRNIFVSQTPQSMVPPGIRVIGVKRPKPNQLETALSSSKEDSLDNDHITPRFASADTESPLKKPRPNALLELTEAANMVHSGQVSGSGKKDLSTERQKQMANALSILNKSNMGDVTANANSDKPAKVEFHRSESEHKQLLEKANETKDIMQLIQLIEDYKKEQKKHNVKWTDVPLDEEPPRSSGSEIYPDKKGFQSYSSVPNHSNHSVDSLLTKQDTSKKFVNNFNPQKDLQDSLRQKLANHLNDSEKNETEKYPVNSNSSSNLFESYMNFIASADGANSANSQRSAPRVNGYPPASSSVASGGPHIQPAAQTNAFAQASAMFQPNSIKELIFLQQLASFQPEGIKKFLAMLWASRVTHHVNAAKANTSFPVNQFLNDIKTSNSSSSSSASSTVSLPKKIVKKEDEDKKELSRQQNEITKRLSVSNTNISQLIFPPRPPVVLSELAISKSAISGAQKILGSPTQKASTTNANTKNIFIPTKTITGPNLSDKGKTVIKPPLSIKKVHGTEKVIISKNNVSHGFPMSSSIPAPLLTLTPSTSTSLQEPKIERSKNKVRFANDNIPSSDETSRSPNDIPKSNADSSSNIKKSIQNGIPWGSTVPTSLQRLVSQDKGDNKQPPIMTRQPSHNFSFPGEALLPDNLEKLSFTLLDNFLSQSGGIEFQEGMSFDQKLQAFSASFGKNISFGKNASFGKTALSSNNNGSSSSFDKTSFQKQFFSALTGCSKTTADNTETNPQSNHSNPTNTNSILQDMKIAMPRFSTVKSELSSDMAKRDSESNSEKLNGTPSSKGESDKSDENSSNLWKPQKIHHPVSQSTSILPVPTFNPYGMKPGALDPSMFQGKSNSNNNLVKGHNWLLGESPQKICKQDEDGDTLLHCLIASGNEEQSTMVAKRVGPVGIDIRNKLGQSALHVAAAMSLPELMSTFVKLGADITLQDAKGNTALHLACETNRMDIVESLFIKEQMTIRRERYYEMITRRNGKGLGAIHISTMNGNLDIVRYLLGHGARSDMQENRSGKTCLIIALEKNFLEIAEVLIRNKVSVNTAAYSGNTPLHFACNANQFKMAKMLLEQDADVSVRNMDGQSPKDLASSKEVKKILETKRRKECRNRAKEKDAKPPSPSNS